MPDLMAAVRLRMGAEDAHYQGDLVDGARILRLFGDVATELMIRHDGLEGLFRAYDQVDFLAPVYAGDYVLAEGRITRVGNTSREMEFKATKLISRRRVLDPPIVVATARGTCVARRLPGES